MADADKAVLLSANLALLAALQEEGLARPVDISSDIS
jgi:hypothetical protein